MVISATDLNTANLFRHRNFGTRPQLARVLKGPWHAKRLAWTFSVYYIALIGSDSSDALAVEPLITHSPS